MTVFLHRYYTLIICQISEMNGHKNRRYSYISFYRDLNWIHSTESLRMVERTSEDTIIFPRESCRLPSLRCHIWYMRDAQTNVKV